MRWSIGIDPGLIETGLILCRDAVDPEVMAWRTYTSPPGNDDDLTRCIALAGYVVDQVVEWVEQYRIDELDVTIELPVYTRNARGFTKQIRLLEEIESGLFHIVAGSVGQFYMTEVYPSTSKALLTNDGRADKDAMITTYERVTGQVWPADTNKHTRETVADAYAHSLACWLHGLTTSIRMDFTKMRAAPVTMKGIFNYEDR